MGRQIGNWEVTDEVTLEDIEASIKNRSNRYSAAAGSVLRYTLTFAQDGKVTFSSSGGSESNPVYGYLSTGKVFDSINGCPSTIIASDESSRNFSFTYTVKKGTPYYLWARRKSKTENPNFTITIDTGIEEPWGMTTTSLGTLSENFSASYSNNTGWVRRFQIKFSQSGTATFYTIGDADTFGYLSTSAEFDSSAGAPEVFLLKDDDSGAGFNFSISYNVTAETTYYVWVRGYDRDSSAINYTFCVTAPVTTLIWQMEDIDSNLNMEKTYSTAVASLSTKESFLYRYTFSFKSSGSATFQITTSSGKIYLTTSQNFDSSTGIPENSLVSQTGEVSFTYTVTAGTVYYLWVRGTDIGTALGGYSLVITPPAEKINKITFYVFTGGVWKEASGYVYKEGSGWRAVSPVLFTGRQWQGE